jgi:quinolinate synthase
VSYVNTTAAIKAESDYCVTSGNAEAVVRSIPEDSQILFLPDLYLGSWLKERTGRSDMLIWPGECHVHAGIRVAEMRRRLEAHSNAEMLIHPECGCTSRFVHASARGQLDAGRTFVLSTEGMVKHARSSTASTMIVATENGLLHRLAKEAPGKTYIAADESAVCRYMKQITLPKLRDSLLYMHARVEVDEETANRARTAIERMVAVRA